MNPPEPQPELAIKIPNQPGIQEPTQPGILDPPQPDNQALNQPGSSIRIKI